MIKKEFKENVNGVEFMHLVARITDRVLMDELKKNDLGSEFIVDYLYEIEEAYLDEDYKFAFSMFINLVGVINKDLEMLLKVIVRPDEEFVIRFLDYYLNHIADSYQVDALFSSCDDCNLDCCCEDNSNCYCNENYDFRSEDSLYSPEEHLDEEFTNDETNSEEINNEVSISLNLAKLLEAVEDLINSAVKEVIDYERSKGDCHM